MFGFSGEEVFLTFLGNNDIMKPHDRFPEKPERFYFGDQ